MIQVELLKAPIKSEGDKKDYRLIRLPNGLKALLIRTHEDNSPSDSEILAAAALTVGVASFDDPPHIGGLAHFLEHMLFMGSEKYPEEGGYNQIVIENGGRNNASTDNEHTFYYFDVSESAFVETLDRFAQQFISPLLLRNALQREREAVDSEFQMGMARDTTRLEVFYRSLINENHPGSFFDFGNLQSLKHDITDDDLYAAVRIFFKKYVANKMFVSIQSKRSLDELQQLVVDNFSPIKSGTIQTRAHQNDKVETIFKTSFHKKMHFVKPKKDLKDLVITWNFASVHPHYKCNPLSYIEKIFSNQGLGGISGFLLAQQLAIQTTFSISGPSFENNSMFALAKFEVNLTEHGLENVDQVLEAIFSYLLMIKETPMKEHRRLYNELREMKENDFKFHKEVGAQDTVIDTSIAMRYYEDVDILRGSVLYQKFDEQVISKIINVMNQRRFNLTIVSSKHEKFDKKTKYFGIEYDEVDFPKAYQKLWDEREANPDFFLEESNPFKSSNFEIFVKKDESTKHPVKILDDDVFEVWHKLDDKYKMPFVFVNLNLISPKTMSSSYNYLLMVFFEKIATYLLSHEIYMPGSAGLDVSFNTTEHGLELLFHGYNEKLHLLIDIVTKKLKNIADDLDETAFEILRADIKKNLFNSLVVVSELNTDYFTHALKHNHWIRYDMYQDIDKIRLEEVLEFQQKFFVQFKMQVLIQGNLKKSHAFELVSMVRDNLSPDHHVSDYDLKGRGYKLPRRNFALRMKSLLKGDENSYTKIFYQAGFETIRSECILTLLETILHTKAFDSLRSKDQLGYDVGTLMENNSGILGFSLYITSQEQKNSHVVVQEKMESFMAGLAQQVIEELSDENFETYRQARIKSLQADDADLYYETERYWNEITTGDLMFDRKTLSIKVAKELTKVEVQEFFKQITQENVRKLTVQVVGGNHDESLSDDLVVEFLSEKSSVAENVVTKIGAFHNDMVLYPVVKIMYG